jgi:hypothetical protein
VFENNPSLRGSQPFTVYAICAREPAAYSVDFTGPVSDPAGALATALLSCPAGSVPLSGGGASDTSSVDVFLNETEPDGGNWISDQNNDSGTAANLYGWVVCAGG